MQVSKEKICKCGHLKLEHKKNPNSKLSMLDECKKCKCTEYMNRKLPNKFSVFSMVLGFFTMGFLALTGISLYYLGSLGWDKPVDINVGTLVTMTIGLFVLMGLIVFNSTLFDYFKEKKRKEYPIE